MAPHLLTLPAEIRHRILEYATQHEEISICDKEVFWAHPSHFRTVRNPNASLWLVCKHISADLRLISIPKHVLRVCGAECGFNFFKPNVSLWKSRVVCFRRFYEPILVERLNGSVLGWIEERWMSKPDFLKRYEIEGDTHDPHGVEVASYV